MDGINNLQIILTQAIQDMKEEQGKHFDIEHINLAELERRTGISRSRLRSLKKNGFRFLPNGNSGRKSSDTIISAYSHIIDSLLKQGTTNSEVCLEKLRDAGYSGGLTTVKNYISTHQNLVPAKRVIESPQGNRGRRYQTGPGESYQMDWGFVNVEDERGNTFRAACFCMVCHHCGQRFVEFFPDAKQEHLFIGMIHGFIYMGVPEYILTDNMKSVVIKRDSSGNPIWQKDYDIFMKDIGFKTRLCKPGHPFTKGKVERLVRYVKENFLAAGTFSNITDLNCQALNWCNSRNGKYSKASDCVPNEIHIKHCMASSGVFTLTENTRKYLCPIRKISFDGFVHYEGRRFGIPYWYTEKTCRIMRDSFTLYIYDTDLSQEIARHNVTWSRSDTYCSDQYVLNQPEELPTARVTTTIKQLDEPVTDPAFEKFNFGKKVDWSHE